MDQTKPHRRRIKIRVRTKEKRPEVVRREWKARLRTVSTVLAWVAAFLIFATGCYFTIDKIGNPPRAGVPVKRR